METVANTGGVPARVRFDRWRQLVGNGFAPMDISTDRPDRFHAEQRVVSLGGVQVWEAGCSRSQASRTPALVRRSDPETLCLLVTLNGTLLAESAGRTAACAAGDLYVHDSSHPLSIAFREPGRGPYRGMSVMLPRAELPFLPGRIDRAVGLRVPREDGVGALVSAFLAHLVPRSGDLSPADGPRLGAVARELTGTLLARIADTGAPDGGRPGRHVLALRVKEFIAANLGDPDLTPAVVAAAHHISASYLHQVFRCQDTTVARWIRHQRLEHARRDLADPARAALTVQDVAARWGFRHPSDFTRAFRSAYGQAPSGYRRTTLAAAPTGARSRAGLVDRPRARATPA